MSAYTTLRITRSKAKVEIVKSLLEGDDDMLASHMDNLLISRLYNVIIVPDDEPNDDEAI